MKLGIIGLTQSGRSTIFAALGAKGDVSDKDVRKDPMIGTVRVLDERMDFLSKIYQPKKTTYAQVEYLLPRDNPSDRTSQSEGAFWNQARVCDALIHVVRNFKSTGGIAPNPEMDFWRLEEEMTINDLAVIEKRIARIELDRKRGKLPENDEVALLQSCRSLLEDSLPIRSSPEMAASQVLKGFTFLTAKPQLVIINNDDDDESMPRWNRSPENLEMVIVRGRLEMELASMSPDEAEEFRVAYNIRDSALDRVIKRSYRILNRISFFTVNDDEAKAWTIHQGTTAVEAAGAVHSDIRKGFIRAEVLAYNDLQKYGSFKDARKAGHLRLEGKDYVVQDGDIIYFRFNI